jgi:hypothetical protein
MEFIRDQGYEDWGDVAEIFELKLASLAEFNAGIEHYFK